MSENYRTGDGSYKRHLREEQETEFISKAVKAIEEGQPWSAFYAKNPQYGLVNPAKWEHSYNSMADRRKASKIGEWSIETELQNARNRRMQEQLTAANNRMYETHREDLLEMAADHAGWAETKARLKLTDDMESLFRRAQAEAGVFKSSERPDPFAAAFYDGFFS